MAEHSKIEWTDATWNPITGCQIVSPGCTNCYAMKLAGTRLQHHPSRKGLTQDSKAGPVWTGEVRFNEVWLDQPLRWKRPRMIFVCAHGDLFADGVKDEWIDQIFAVMALSPQHIFQVLTKRPERMREYLTEAHRQNMIAHAFIDLFLDKKLPKSAITNERLPVVEGPSDAEPDLKNWPLPNVWLGVSVEDQTRADERIPILLDTPAAVRWISAEPLLGPIDVLPYLFIYTHEDNARLSLGPNSDEPILPFRDPATTPAVDICIPRIDWVVAGGESGQGARPMHPDWARSLRDQCASAGVAFHFKQWGEWVHPIEFGMDDPVIMRIQSDANHLGRTDEVAYLNGDALARVGKKHAGRLLDGITHDGFPQVERVG